MEEIIGSKINEWTIVDYVGVRALNKHYLARCSCGNLRQARLCDFRKTKYCRKCSEKYGIARRQVDFTNKIFGDWTVLKYSHRRKCNNKKGYDVYWICKCKCGTIKTKAINSLTQFRSTKCKKCALKIIYANRIKKINNVKSNLLNSLYSNDLDVFNE